MIGRFLCVLALAGTALAADAATLDRLRTFVRDTQTARTQFTQTVVDKSGRTGASASGTSGTGTRCEPAIAITGE